MCSKKTSTNIPADQKPWSPRVPLPHQAECKAAGRNSRCWSAESLTAAHAAPSPGQSDAFASQNHPHAERQDPLYALNEQEFKCIYKVFWLVGFVWSTVLLTSLVTPGVNKISDELHDAAVGISMVQGGGSDGTLEDVDDNTAAQQRDRTALDKPEMMRENRSLS